MSVLLVESGIALPERERVGAGAWLDEGDLQRPLEDRVVLAHELVEAALPKHAVAVLVDVDACRRARSLAVDEHTEGDRPSGSGRHHEVRVARGEPECDAPAGLFEDDALRLVGPRSG